MSASVVVQPYHLPAHGCISEPLLRFHPQRLEDLDSHPLIGLDRLGPYSRPILGAVSDPIRVAVIGSAECIPNVERLLQEMERAHRPRERTAYLIDFRGFSSIFGTRVVLAATPRVLISKETDAEIERSSSPHRVLAENLARAVNAVSAHRSEFDVLLVYLPTRWQICFTGGNQDEFDLHDFVKGHTASLSIPAQIVREDKALSYSCRCSVMWRLGIALYCKAGGIPWKLAYTEPDTMYVGLGYAMKFDERGAPHFLTTCSQVFDHDGTGLEFLAYETRDMIREGRNAFLKRNDMHRVMSRSLSLYQHRHSGKPPNSVVVHKLLPFKDEEVDGCFDAFRAVKNIELVQIQKDAIWRGAHLDPPASGSHDRSKAGYACRRGSYLLLGGDEALLWTQGNVPQGSRDFFKEMKGTPSPLVIRRFAGQGPFNQTCHAILGLTKMDWNNDALYDRLPVTQSFASVLAQTLKRMPSLTTKPYSFRLFM